MTEKIYKIGEAAQLLNLKSYVLRFWETEFPQLKPTRTESGQRLYSERDLELLGRIRHLLHERGLTIEGARKILSDVHYATDDGLSRELLDEGYKDFIADLEVAGQEAEDLPGQTAVFPGGQPLSMPESLSLHEYQGHAPDGRATPPQGRAARNEELLDEVLRELKELRELFRQSSQL